VSSFACGAPRQCIHAVGDILERSPDELVMIDNRLPDLFRHGARRRLIDIPGLDPPGSRSQQRWQRA
jgi:hypothetical protein